MQSRPRILNMGTATGGGSTSTAQVFVSSGTVKTGYIEVYGFAGGATGSAGTVVFGADSTGTVYTVPYESDGNATVAPGNDPIWRGKSLVIKSQTTGDNGPHLTVWYDITASDFN